VDEMRKRLATVAAISVAALFLAACSGSEQRASGSVTFASPTTGAQARAADSGIPPLNATTGRGRFT
jgi:ABC-type glycerol-3-phosphate transport system substrate-binding protein